MWKIDLYLHGHGNEQLLDSYSAERLPVIKNVIGITDRLTKVLGTPNKFAQTLRDIVIPVISRLTPFQQAFVQRLSGLTLHFNAPAEIIERRLRGFRLSPELGGEQRAELSPNRRAAWNSRKLCSACTRRLIAR